MSDILSISFPLFFLIILGYLAYRFRVVDDGTPSVLIGFVYYFLLPPFLFMKIIDADVHEKLDEGILLAYYLPVIVIFIISFISSRWLYAYNGKTAVIRSIAAIAANTGYLGLPIVILAYGERVIIPTIAIVLIDNLIVLIGGSLLLETAVQHGARWQVMVTNSVMKVIHNPLIVSIVLGLLYVITIGVIPKPVHALGKTMADATLPCALFALGATLAQHRGVNGASTDKYQVVLFKLLLHPLLAFLFGKFIFHLDGIYLALVLVMAAMPVSVNTFIMASRHNVYVREISSILFLTTCISMFTVTILLFIFSG